MFLGKDGDRTIFQVAYIVMAYIVVAYIVMAYIVMASAGTATAPSFRCD